MPCVANFSLKIFLKRINCKMEETRASVYNKEQYADSENDDNKNSGDEKKMMMTTMLKK